MSEGVLIAIIAAVPPTVAAIAAAWQVRRLSRPIEQVNEAVNHRQPGQRKLIDMVEDIRGDVASLRDSLERHRAWHALMIEDDPAADEPF